MKRDVAISGLALMLCAAATPSPGAEMNASGIAHLSGGIGVAEQESIKAREKEFNLKLVFTLVEGNYLADVGVAVKDGAGKTVLEDVASGPFFLAKLAPGKYTIAATYDGKTVKRNVQVGGKSLRTEYLRWPSNPETDYPLPREQAANAKSSRG